MNPIPNLRIVKSLLSFPDTISLMSSDSLEIDCSPIDNLIDNYRDLEPCKDSLVDALKSIVTQIKCSNTLFLCGNGGSFSDCLHICGELKKSFEKSREIPDEMRLKLLKYENGDLLARNLQVGVRSLVLGNDPTLSSAIDNDIDLRYLNFAQELFVLGREGDILLALSTSGMAQNVVNAVTVAKALGIHVVALTGNGNSTLMEMADIVINAPSNNTAQVQIWHSQIYHALCRALENSLFRNN